MAASYFTQHFNFELVDKKYDEMVPVASVSMSRKRAVKVSITKYEE